MGYIPNNDSLNIGDEVILNRNYSSCAGIFTKGTRVRITDCIPIRGYTIEDEYGNRRCELGFDIGRKVK